MTAVHDLGLTIRDTYVYQLNSFEGCRQQLQPKYLLVKSGQKESQHSHP